ncbi:hypothetical protein D3C77_158010 [compost metagenome]
MIGHKGHALEFELVVGTDNGLHRRWRHLIPGLATLGEGGERNTVEVEGAMGIGRCLDQQFLNELAPIEVAYVQVHGDGNALAWIQRPLIFLPGRSSHVKETSLIPDGQGQHSIIGIPITIHQVEVDLLHQGVVAVIYIRPGGEAVIPLGVDHQGAYGLPCAVCDRNGGVAAGGNGVFDPIDGDRPHHGIVGPLAGGSQQIAAHFRPLVQGLAVIVRDRHIVPHADVTYHLAAEIPIAVQGLQRQLDIQQIIALGTVIQIAGQLEGITAGDIQGQLEDELAPAVLAQIDTRLAVGADADGLAPGAELVEGVEAGHIQLQGHHLVATRIDDHLPGGFLPCTRRVGAPVLTSAAIEIRLIDGDTPDGADHGVGGIFDHCRCIAVDHRAIAVGHLYRQGQGELVVGAVIQVGVHSHLVIQGRRAVGRYAARHARQGHAQHQGAARGHPLEAVAIAARHLLPGERLTVVGDGLAAGVHDLTGESQAHVHHGIRIRLDGEGAGGLLVVRRLVAAGPIEAPLGQGHPGEAEGRLVPFRNADVEGARGGVVIA